VFSNNQHQEMAMDFDWCCGTFKAAIAAMGRTVMVLAPWHDPVPLTRGWCLFELYCTADTGSTFEVAMSREQQRLFLDAMAAGGLTALHTMLATVDVERSECGQAADRDRIFDAVRRTVGFAGINAMVFAQLRGWVVATAGAALRRVEGMTSRNKARAVGLKNTLAALHFGQGSYDLAEPLLLDVLVTQRELLGDTHPATVKALNNVAALYERQGKYEAAAPLAAECLAARKQVLGDRHPDTLVAMNNLAALCKGRGEYEAAEALYVACLASTREVLGATHPRYTVVLNNLAAMHEARGDYGAAEPLYVECLAVRREVLGDRHPSTLVVMNNLAALHEVRGAYGAAEALYVECSAVRREVLGASHPDTVASAENLATLLGGKEKETRRRIVFDLLLLGTCLFCFVCYMRSFFYNVT
jgi:tetratricopeptide (TPR) repeat protein